MAEQTQQVNSAADDKVQKAATYENKSGAARAFVIFTTIFPGIIIIGIIMWMQSRNKFKKDEIEIESSVSQIDVYLRQRFDMLSKMVDSIKGSMKFEKETLSTITAMRSGLGGVQRGTRQSSEQLQQIENQMNEVTNGINMQMERYPELQSSKLVIEFIKQTKDVEENLAAARRIYNRNVKLFNQRVVAFPAAFMAKAMGLEKWKMYEVAEYAKADVKVDFGF